VKPIRRESTAKQGVREMPDRRIRVARLVLWASLAALIAHLIGGDHPWSGGIAERVTKGLPIRPIDCARTYRWWISLGSAAVALALLATLRGWIGSQRAAECPELAAPDRGARAVAAVAALAMLVAALMAAPRLEFSFWDDERVTVQFSVDGRYERDPEGDLLFREVRWRDSWLYTIDGPNNHVPFSLLARLSLGAWRAVAQPKLRFASERAVRLPAFAFGIAAVGALAWCLWRVGLPWAAGFAAILLAIHPWHLRYTSEARGYSLLVLCMPLLLLAMVAVLHRGSWRRWIAFGAVEVVLLWVYPGGTSILAVANAALAFELFRRHRDSLREPVARWLATSLAAAAVFMLLMGPNVLIFLWHSEWNPKGIKWTFVRDVLSHLWVGTAFAFRHSPEHYAELRDVAREAPAFFRTALVATGALCLLGAVRLALRGRAGASLLAVVLLPAPLLISSVHLRESMIYERHVIFALPSFAILLGAGLEGLFTWLRPPRARAAATFAVMLAYLAGYLWLSRDVHAALRTLPIQPTREAVLIMRPSLDPFAEENRGILTASCERILVHYDPNIQVVLEKEQLLALLEEADRTDRPLYLSYGRPWLARREYAELMEMVEREDLFEPVTTLYGFEPRGLMRVFRYRGR
jgi:hypothetical protein